MALVHTQTIARLFYRDREGTEDCLRLCYPVAIDPEEAIAASTSGFAAVVGALSDSPLAFVETEFLYVDDGPGQTVAVDLSQCGVLLFRCIPSPDDQLLVSIPAMTTSCYLADGVTMNTSDTAVATLVSELLAPGAAIICNPFDATINSFETGMRRTVPVMFPEATG